MTDNLQPKSFDQRSNEYNFTKQSSDGKSTTAQRPVYTFTFVDTHLLIHCSQIGLARKISWHLLELTHHPPSVSIPHNLSPALITALSHITNVTNTEYDIELSQSPIIKQDWDIIAQYISSIIDDLISEKNLCISESISLDESTLKELHIPLSYDGPDLSSTSHALGLSETEFIRWHSSRQWNVAFMGFSPGFAYLRCNNGYKIPRRDTPRATVPPGSVALGGEYCGIYPRESPGGWQIIGTTFLEVWNPTARSPNLITPMSTIRFIPL